MDELVERVRLALAAQYPGAPNGRVRDVPDRRAIRWYATTGLVDRPAAMRGRTALYGRRHLLQLVAVKRRQADGRTLAEIQAELAGATDATLAGIARVPDELLADDDAGGYGPSRDPAADGTAESVRRRFWATAPVPHPTAATPTDSGLAVATPTGPDPAGSTSVRPASAAPAPLAAASKAPAPTAATSAATASTTRIVPATVDSAWTDSRPVTFAGADSATVHRAHAVPLAGVALGGGAVLLLPGRPAADDYAAIADAAGPLVDLLAARGLLAFAGTGAASGRHTDGDPAPTGTGRATAGTPGNPESSLLTHHDGSSR